MGYFLAALVSGFFLFNASATPQKAARLAQSALQKQFPGAVVNVEIEGKRGAPVLKGNFKSVRVRMSHLTLAGLPFEPSQKPQKLGHAGQIELDLSDLTLGSMPISRAHLLFEDVAYDFGALKKRAQFQIVRQRAAHLQLQLSASALLPAFAARLKDTTDVTVSTEGQTLTLRGNRSVLGNLTPIVVSGQLSGQGAQLRLENAILTIGGVRVPGPAASVLLKDLNPLYDFDSSLQWPFQSRITSANGQGNQIDIKADLTLRPVSTGNSSP